MNSYLLLNQGNNRLATVSYVNTDNKTEFLLFEGGRVTAKKFLRNKQNEAEFNNVPAFNKKRKGTMTKLIPGQW